MRQKVKDVVDFIQDDERLRIERKKARKAKDKYVGLSSENQPAKYSEFLIIIMSIDFGKFQSGILPKCLSMQFCFRKRNPDPLSK